MPKTLVRIILQAEPAADFVGPPPRVLKKFSEKGFSIMCKKLCIAVGAVILGLVAVMVVPKFSTHASAVYDKVFHWANEVPPEAQLQQLKKNVDLIDQDIKKNLGQLAAQEVQAERLETSLTKMKEKQTALREEIEAMSKALDSKETRVSWKGTNYSKSELALRLESKVNDYELHKTEIKTREQVLVSKKQSLELAHQRIREMKEQKEELRVTIAKLEARIEQIKLKQAENQSTISLDDSQVSKCHDLANKLSLQLDEEQKKSELLDRYGYTKEPKYPSREEKSTDEFLKAAKKALQDDDEKVVGK